MSHNTHQKTRSGLLVPHHIAREQAAREAHRDAYRAVIQTTADEIWSRWTGQPADGWEKVSIPRQ